MPELSKVSKEKSVISWKEILYARLEIIWRHCEEMIEEREGDVYGEPLKGHCSIHERMEEEFCSNQWCQQWQTDMNRYKKFLSVKDDRTQW